MDPATFLTHAADLANRGTPADCRSAVSRAYYAAHHAAIEFLRGAGVGVPETGTAHVAVLNILLSAGDLDIREAGVKLSTLHTRRDHADYKWDKLETEQPAIAHDVV